MHPRSGLPHARRRLALVPAVLVLLSLLTPSAQAVHTEPTFTVAPGPSIGVPLAPRVALVDGDAVPDLVTGLYGGGFAVQLGRGDGTFGAPVTTPVAESAYVTPTGDVDGDGDLDVVVLSGADSGVLRTFLGRGDGTFTAGPVSASVVSTFGSVLADVDNDADLDLAVPVNGTVALYLGNGTGAFVPGPVVPAAGVLSAYAPVAAMLNNDLYPDLVLPNNGGNLYVLLSTGPATYAPVVKTAAVSKLGVAVADVSGDSVPDIVYANGSRAGALLFDPLTSTFSDTTVSGALTAALGVAVADLDGDGRNDVAVTSGGQERFLLNDGGGAFTLAAAQYPADSNSYTQSAADLNRDGFPDLVVTSPTGHRNTVLVNTSGPPAPTVTTQPGDATVSAGETWMLSAAATGSPTPTARWQRRDAGSTTWTDLTAGTTTPTSGGVLTGLSGTTVPGDDGVSYRVLFGSGVGALPRTATTAVATLHVVPRAAPSFATPPVDTTGREGGTATFSFVAAGSPRPTVSWAVANPGENLFTELETTASSLPVTSLTPAMSGSRYRVTLTSDAGTITRTVQLVVDPAARITGQPADAAVRPGDAASFTVVHSPGTVVWQLSADGATWSTLPETSDTLAVTNTVPAQDGAHYRAVLHPAGTSSAPDVVSREALLRVDAAPGAPAGLTATETAPGRVTVRWTPPTPATDVTGYSLTIGGVSTQHAATVREVVLEGVPPGAAQVEVRTLDALGPGASALTSITVTGGGASPSPSSSASASPRPSTSASPSPSATASASASASASAGPSASPTASSTASPSASASGPRARGRPPARRRDRAAAPPRGPAPPRPRVRAPPRDRPPPSRHPPAAAAPAAAAAAPVTGRPATTAPPPAPPSATARSRPCRCSRRPSTAARRRSGPAPRPPAPSSSSWVTCAPPPPTRCCGAPRSTRPAPSPSGWCRRATSVRTSAPRTATSATAWCSPSARRSGSPRPAPAAAATTSAARSPRGAPASW